MTVLPAFTGRTGRRGHAADRRVCGFHCLPPAAPGARAGGERHDRAKPGRDGAGGYAPATPSCCARRALQLRLLRNQGLGRVLLARAAAAGRQCAVGIDRADRHAAPRGTLRPAPPVRRTGAGRNRPRAEPATDARRRHQGGRKHREPRASDSLAVRAGAHRRQACLRDRRRSQAAHLPGPAAGLRGGRARPPPSSMPTALSSRRTVDYAERVGTPATQYVRDAIGSGRRWLVPRHDVRRLEELHGLSRLDRSPAGRRISQSHPAASTRRLAGRSSRRASRRSAAWCSAAF